MCGSAKIPWQEIIECSELLHGMGMSTSLYELKRDEPLEIRSQAFGTGSLNILRMVKGLCHGELVMHHDGTGWDTRADAGAWFRTY